MEVLNASTFDNPSTALLMAEEGYLDTFLDNCGGMDVDDEEDYWISLCAATCVFPDLRQYYNEEIEAEIIVIFDPLIDEFCRLCTEYEQRANIEPGESDLRRAAIRYIYDSFDFPGYCYDYNFCLCDGGHGRKRLVMLYGMEFCGFNQLPQAFADIRNALECQMSRLHVEMGQKTEQKEAA